MTTKPLTWHEVFPPRDADVAAMTTLVRPLLSRPSIGLLGRVPVVTVEQWALRGTVRHMIGVEAPLGDGFVDRLVAGVPGMLSRRLGHEAVKAVRRPVFTGYEIGMTSAAASLRTDVATEVSAAMGSALQASRADATVVQWVIGPSRDRATAPTPFDLAAELGFYPKPKETAQDRSAWRTKASEPLFAVRGRIGTSGGRGELSGVRQAIQIAESAHNHLTFLPSPRTPERIASVARSRWGGIVSATELAVLLGWPLDDADHAWQLPIGDPAPPTPASRVTPTEGRRPGVSQHPASLHVPVLQPTTAITRGMWLLGPIGSGKSVLIEQMILADIAAGRPVIFIDPKGDAARAVLARIDRDALARTVFFDGAATTYPVGLNLLAGSRGDAERRADELLGIFRAEFGTAIGARSADVLLHALIMAARLPDGTLADVPAILTNPGFRRRIAGSVGDPVVVAPWLGWFESLSDAERAQIVAPVLNKLRAFLSRTSIRRIVGQASPGWSFDEVLAERGIVLVSLNRGEIGSDTARLLGTLVLHAAWTALQRRLSLPASKRDIAALYIDEWPQFAGAVDIGDMAATIRGTDTGLVLASQNIGQTPAALRSIIAANLRSLVAFAPGTDDRAAVAKLIGSPLVTADDLGRLTEFDAIARIHGGSGAQHIRTIPLGTPRGDVTGRLRQSGQRFGRDGEAIDADLLARWDSRPTGGVGRVARGDQS